MSREFDDDFDYDDTLEDSEEEETNMEVFEKLSPQQYNKLVKDLENFTVSLFSYLAGTSNYEIITSEPRNGYFFTKKDYDNIKKECEKIGAEVLYTYKVGKNSIVVNPKTLKTVVLNDGQAH